jgi:potassium uptake TrkH family protein
MSSSGRVPSPLRRGAPGAVARLQTFVASPVRVVPLGFAGAIVLGALLLLLPASRGESTDRVSATVALFHATSAVCVTGLSSVDTPVYWSTFGHAVILVLVQVGGIGIATLTALLGIVVARRMGLRSRLTAAAGSGVLEIGTVRSVVTNVGRIFLVCEGVLAAVLSLRFLLHYDEPPARAVWLGVFHAVSAFNNAGFALFSDNLVGFAGDAWITVPIMTGVVLGGLGFPVIVEVLRRTRVRLWSINTRLILIATAALLVSGAALIGALEWDNPATLGSLPPGDRVMNAVFMSVTPRTAGFNTVDYGAVEDAGLLATTALMFIGGGSASTAGGIKVGTVAVLVLAIWAEARGQEDTAAFDRRIDGGTVRQALAVSGLYATQIIVGTIVLLEVADAGLTRSLFEVVSATGTVGLSANLTPVLPEPALWVLTACMYLGRIGPATLVAALALSSRKRLYRLPPGRPLIG